MNRLVKASLTSGISVYVICMISVLLGADFLALLVITFLVGPIYVIILLLNSSKVSTFRALVFLLTSIGLYYLVIYFLNIHNYMDHFLPYKIMVASTLASVLLFMAYGLCLSEFQWKNMLIATWAGVNTSLISAIAAFGFRYLNNNDHALFSLLALGLFSIFPLWQYRFSKLLIKTNP